MNHCAEFTERERVAQVHRFDGGPDYWRPEDVKLVYLVFRSQRIAPSRHASENIDVLDELMIEHG